MLHWRIKHRRFNPFIEDGIFTRFSHSWKSPQSTIPSPMPHGCRKVAQGECGISQSLCCVFVPIQLAQAFVEAFVWSPPRLCASTVSFQGQDVVVRLTLTHVSLETVRHIDPDQRQVCRMGNACGGDARAERVRPPAS